MKSYVCPSWFAAPLQNPLRRLIHNPDMILDGLVVQGQTVVDLGCGPGFFSIPMARMVGPAGKVIAVDLQQKMLDRLSRRAARENLQSRIQLHRCEPQKIGIVEPADFALAFWMVHEVPNREVFLGEVRNILRVDGHFLFVEPKLHVSAASFQKTVDFISKLGFNQKSAPMIRLSRAVLFAVPRG